MTVARIDKPLAHWIQYIWIVLGCPSNMGPRIRDHFFGQFWKLGFCSVGECKIFAHGGQLRILLNREFLDSFPTWNMPKHSWMTYRNPVFMHGFHSMP